MRETSMSGGRREPGFECAREEPPDGGPIATPAGNLDPRLERNAGRAWTGGNPSRRGGSLFAIVVTLAALVLVLGLWAVRAERPRAPAPLEPDEVALDPGETATGLDEPEADPAISVRTSAPVTPANAQRAAVTTLRVPVRVRRADGQPVGAWTLEVEDSGRARKRQDAARRSLEFSDPAVSLELESGSVQALWARAEGCASATAWLRVNEAGARQGVEFVLAPATAVEGQVVDEWGTPVAGVRVWFVPAFPADGAKPARALLAIATETDVLGTFRAPALVPGRWSLCVGDRLHPLARLDEVALTGARVRLDAVRLPRLHELLVRVRGENGESIAGARTSGSGSNGGTFELATDGLGEARAERLPAGRFRVFADAGPRGRTNRIVEVPAEKSVDLEVRAAPRPR